jgi:hypothetical protein
MHRCLLMIVILACIGSFPVFAGETFIHGPVSGIWSEGQIVIVDGPLSIPDGEELQIQQGVQIEFLTLDSVVISGQLTVQGTSGNPVTMSVPNGWTGMQFEPNPTNLHKLAGLWVGTEGGLPRRVLTGLDARFEIADCKFRARDVCLDIDGGQVRAFGNTFLTTGMLSKTVRLRNLHRGVSPYPCDDSESSTLARGNMLSAIVPDLNQQVWGQVFTTALDVSNCSRLCLDSVFITVDAPCMAVGAHFSYESTEGTADLSLNRSTVTVRSPRGQPFGLLGTEGGTLNVIHCNVDVANPLDVTGFQPSGMSIWGQADMYINSSVVMIDKGQRWFVPRDDATGLITVTHVDKWSLDASATAAPTVVVEDTQHVPQLVPTSWNKDAILEEGPNYLADPQFKFDGEWGAWDSPDDFGAYYGLSESSPCIDKADTQYGFDPDNTLPDIGQFYYFQSPVIDSAEAADDELVLPSALALSAPYPNPFNSITVVPFHLIHAGAVEMSVYDLLGRKVATLASGQMHGGSHSARFAADNLPSGLYIVTLEFNGARIGNQSIFLLK